MADRRQEDFYEVVMPEEPLYERSELKHLLEFMKTQKLRALRFGLAITIVRTLGTVLVIWVCLQVC